MCVLDLEEYSTFLCGTVLLCNAAVVMAIQAY